MPAIWSTANPARYGGSSVYLPMDWLSQPHGLDAVLEFNGLVFNDMSVKDRYRVTSIDGLHDADVRDARIVRPNEHGELPLISWYGGRTLTITGRIEAGNMQKLRAMIQEMRTAFMPLAELPLWFHNTHFSKTDTENSVYISCRKVVPLSIKEEQSRQQPWRDFQIALRASNPRFLSGATRYYYGDITSEGLHQILSVTNYGNFPTYPKIWLQDGISYNGLGPVPIQIINDTTGQTIRFLSNLSPATFWLIDTEHKTIVDMNGNSVYSALYFPSDWIEIAPGINSISVNAPIITSTPQLAVQVTDAWV